MVAAFDAVGPAGGAGTAFTAATGTWTHVNNGNGILVGITIFSTTANTVTGVTYGGVTIPFLLYVNTQAPGAGTGGFSLYGLTGATCPTGSNTVSVTKTGAVDNANAGSISVSGAGTLRTAVSSAAASTASVSMAVAGTTVGGLIVTGACYGGGSGGGTFTGTNGVTRQVQKWTSNTTGADNLAMGTVASAGGAQTVGFTQNGSTDDWGIISVEVLPGGGGQGMPQARQQRRGKKDRHRRGYQRQQQMAAFGVPAAATVQAAPGLIQFPVTVPDSVSW